VAACIFCSIVEGKTPSVMLVRDDTCTAFLDIHPLSRGHALVVPNVHAAFLTDLRIDVRQHLFAVAASVLAAQRRCGLSAEGANLLLNDGTAANQHIPHVHIHVLPRAPRDGALLVARIAGRVFNVFGRGAPWREMEATAALIRPFIEPSGCGRDHDPVERGCE
jgi:histidine triad (HIT) family protein